MAGALTCAGCGGGLDEHGICPACLLELGLGKEPVAAGRPLPGVNESTAPDPEVRPGAEIGPYLILESLGEGGMGAVYLAEQQRPVRRPVAFKVIKLGMNSREVVGRFESERQALALMDHPGIAKVFDAGTTEHGRPYFVMEHVAGVPITEHCDRRRLSTPQRLELFIEVCLAIHHAHQKGILHRDIKPSNVLVSLVDGRPTPKVIDFGVAKALHGHLVDGALTTRIGQVVGTPSYMSPEQAELGGLDLDTRTDVYALGVLLYELLTGALPFDPGRLRAASYPELRRILQHEEPPTPSLRLSRLGARALQVAERRATPVRGLARQLQGDLDWITLKALEKDRNRRYAAVTELASDIERHLGHQPVLARPPSARYRLTKLVRRHRVTAGALAAVALSMVAALLVSTAQTQRAQAARRETRARLVDLAVATGNRLVEEGEHLDALPWLAQALSLEEGGADRERVHRVRLASVLAQSPKLLQLWFHGGPVRTAQFSPDGATVLTASDDGTARLWDVTSGEERSRFVHGAAVHEARFSPTGHYVATASADRTARLWDAATGDPVTPPLLHAAEAHTAVFSPDGSLLAVGDTSPALSVWEVWAGKLRWTTELGGPEKGVRFSPDGSLLAVSHSLYEIRFLDAASGAASGPPIELGARSEHNTLEFSFDGSQLLTAGDDGRVRIWDVATAVARREAPQYFQVQSAYFSPDGQQVLIASADSMVHRWDLESDREVGEPIRHPTSLRWARYSSDGRSILSLGDDAARLWTLAGHLVTPPMRHSGDRPSAAETSPSGRLLVTAGLDHAVRLWSLTPAEPLLPQLKSPHEFFAVEYSADGGMILGAGGSFFEDYAFARVWSTATSEPLTPPLPHAGGAWGATFSPDGERVASVAQDGTARVWDVASGEPVTPPLVLAPSTEAVASMPAGPAWSPDGRRLAIAMTEAKYVRRGRQEAPGVAIARVWDATSGAPVGPELHHQGAIWSIAFHPDGTAVLTACDDGSAQLWDPVAGRRLFPPLHHDAAVRSALFSVDGSTIITGGFDRTVRFWSSSTGQPLREPLEESFEISVLVLSPDGKRLAGVGEVGVARIWELGGEAAALRIRTIGGTFGVDFSSDGQWLLTTSAGYHSARLWDAATGQVVSAPHSQLAVPGAVAAISPDAQEWAVTDGDSLKRWRLPFDPRPVADLELHAQLLSGQVVSPTGGLVSLAPVAMRAAWERLRELYSEHFRDAPEAIVAADRVEAARLLAAGRWLEAAQALERPLASSTRSATDHARRGRAYAELGHWSEALADFEEGARRRPGSVELEAQAALLRLQLGDRQGHSASCHELLRRFATTRNVARRGGCSTAAWSRPRPSPASRPRSPTSPRCIFWKKARPGTCSRRWASLTTVWGTPPRPAPPSSAASSSPRRQIAFPPVIPTGSKASPASLSRTRSWLSATIVWVTLPPPAAISHAPWKRARQTTTSPGLAAL